MDQARHGPIIEYCDWCGTSTSGLGSVGFPREEAGRLWCGLCPRFPATEALHDAARFAQRAQRYLEELEPGRLDEFEADFHLLKYAVDDVQLILDQRRGRRPPPAPEDLRGSSSTPDP